MMTKRKPRAFTVARVEATEAGFVETFELLLQLHKKGGMAPLDIDDATRNAYRVITQNMTLIARDENGNGIGTIGFAAFPYWYSNEGFIDSAWFYVHPDWRFDKVGVALLRGAREMLQDQDKVVYVTITDPDRRPKQGPAASCALLAGFIPRGHRTRLV